MDKQSKLNDLLEILSRYGYSLHIRPPSKDTYVRAFYDQARTLKRDIATESGKAIPKYLMSKAERRKARAERKRRAKCKPPVKPETNRKWVSRDEWEGFYNTQRWRELRYEVLRRDAATCQCCGAKASDGVRLHVDHIKPRSTHPSLQWKKENLQVLCEDCNFGKSNYYSDDWRVKMA